MIELILNLTSIKHTVTYYQPLVFLCTATLKVEDVGAALETN